MTKAGAKTESKPGQKRDAQKQNRPKSGKKKEGKDEKKPVEYKAGMSYLMEPCPHKVWNPKPGEKGIADPKGFGSPWYEPGRKKEDVDREQAEKNSKKEEKASQKRQKDRDERQKAKEKEEEKKKKEEEKQKEKDKKEEEKKKKEKDEKKKKKEQAQKKKQQKRKEEREKREKEEEKKKDKDKKKPPLVYEPCPHKVYTPMPGEKDLAEPKGITAPWYEKPRKKEDIEKEEQEKNKEDMEKRKEKKKQHDKEKRERKREEEEEERKQNEKMERRERKLQAKREKMREERRREKEEEDCEHEAMGAGVRPSKTDMTPELIWMMNFMADVDLEQREREGEMTRWKKEEMEEQKESRMAREAYTSDFRELVSTFVEAEWSKADKKLRKIEKDERKKRRKMLKTMDPLAKDMLDEGQRFKTLYNAALAKKQKGSGEGKSSPMEDMMVSMIMRQLDNMDEAPIQGNFM